MSIYIYPTDTVWGIGGSIYSQHEYLAVANIKEVTYDKPVSILFPDVASLRKYLILTDDRFYAWAGEFFKLKTTLGIPLEFFKKEIPLWIKQNSSFVGVRVLEYTFLKRIYKEEGGPICSTSLNKTGQPPIVDKTEAKAFFNELKNKDNFIFIDSNEVIPNGTSSDFIVLEPDGNFRPLRKGENSEHIQHTLGLFSAKFLQVLK